jgi:hypothetical protein
MRVTFCRFVVSINTWVVNKPINTPTNTHEVHKVNTNSIAHTIRNSVFSIAAVVMLLIPLIGSAAVSGGSDSYGSLLNTERPAVQNSPEATYGKLKDQSHGVCGSSDLNITGSVRRTNQIQECYQGTLAAAVQRLDNDEVSELHRK